ncbi:MAG: hypothetical protein IBJ14_10455 [Hydrogenophaga sp.]|nr:hypothetical protein [Hydrogenophaga sp.]
MRRWFALLLLTLLLPFTSAAVAACVHEATVEPMPTGHHAHSLHGQDGNADAPQAHAADGGECHAGCGACVLPNARALPPVPGAPCPCMAAPGLASLAAAPPDRPQWPPRPVRG